jgi:hypothetical protein
LKAIVVEDEDNFEKRVCQFYDERYGEGWCERRHINQPTFWVTATATFLSQWYKVSACHGLLRRWYRDKALAGATHGPPVAIMRLRPDHLLTVQWNLTAAAFEFQSRHAAQAAGGNFLAVWGPTSHSEFCGPDLCPDKSTKHYLKGGPEGEQKKSRHKCYQNGRIDDAFAFGTPAAMDVYAAPYHPYQTKVCEEYVTSTLPLGQLVQVGAVHSGGGGFGSLSMPGSCHHRMGHYPLRNRPLNNTRGGFLEYSTEQIMKGDLGKTAEEVRCSYVGEHKKPSTLYC